jgi:hypothetical protein
VAVTWLGYMVSERLQLLLHYLLVHKVYSHIPYFHPEEQIGFGKPGGSIGIPRSHGGVRRAVVEWLWASAASQLILSLLSVVLLGGKAKPSVSGGGVSLRQLVFVRLDPLALCAKLAIVRIVVDVCFAGGHWLIHRPVCTFYHPLLRLHSIDPYRL